MRKTHVSTQRYTLQLNSVTNTDMNLWCTGLEEMKTQTIGFREFRMQRIFIILHKTMCGDLPSCKIVIGSIQHVLHTIMHS